MSGKHKRSTRGRWKLGAAIAVSLVLHLVLLALSLPAGLPWAPPGPDSQGEVILVTTEDPTPSARGRARTPSPAQEVAQRSQKQAKQTKSVPMTTSTEPSDRLPDAVGDESEAVAVEVGDDGDDGGSRGDGDIGEGLDLTPRLTTMIGVFDVPHECRDLLDNDGDRLVDYEDPECRAPETREEAVEVTTEALLLSDLRRNDIPRSDPDELVRKRIQWGLRPSGDHLAYQDGSFTAKIGPDGEVEFDSARSGSGLGFTFDTTPRARRNLRRKSQFLEATEELRDKRDRQTRIRYMKEALSGLEDDLNGIWRDRRLSLNQKKVILFQRLDECDRETPAGRQAAQVIIGFIRARSIPIKEQYQRRPEEVVKGSSIADDL